MTGSDFFSRNAGAYAKSSSHAGGTDLGLLVEQLAVKQNEMAIDVATGTGFTAIAIAESARAVTGVDPNYKMIREAGKLAEAKGVKNLELVIGQAERLPVSTSSFHVATCRRAAHHFVNKPAFLSEVYRILAPGGRFGLVDMVPPDGHADEFNRLEIARDNSHVWAEEVPSWRLLAGEAGFEIAACRTEAERMTFEKWIYPVAPDGEDAAACRKMLREADDSFASAIGLDGDLSFSKGRMVLIARRPLQ